MFGIFVSVTIALILAATMPVANAYRQKGQYLSVATSIGQQQLERCRAIGFGRLDATSLEGAGLLDNDTAVNLQTLGLTSSAVTGYASSNVGSASFDSAAFMLPEGSSYVSIASLNSNNRQVTVTVSWKEKSQTRSVRLSTVVSNL